MSFLQELSPSNKLILLFFWLSFFYLGNEGRLNCSLRASGPASGSRLCKKNAKASALLGLTRGSPATLYLNNLLGRIRVIMDNPLGYSET